MANAAVRGFHAPALEQSNGLQAKRAKRTGRLETKPRAQCLAQGFKDNLRTRWCSHSERHGRLSLLRELQRCPLTRKGTLVKSCGKRARAVQCSLTAAPTRSFSANPHIASNLVASLPSALRPCIAFTALAIAYWHLTPSLLAFLRRLNRLETPEPSKPSATQTTLLSSALLIPAAYPDAVSQFFHSLRGNPTFMSAFIAWTLAQTLKVFTTLYKEGRLDIRKLVASGGMPSSHSSLCVALTTSVAIVHGVSGSLFPVALGFSLIVMYDAAGVRLHAGKQAEVRAKAFV